MDVDKFKHSYSQVRNGCNKFLRHPMFRSFCYSDGVQECAEAGCYWLLDLLALSCPAEFKKQRGVSDSCTAVVTVKDGKAVISLEFKDKVTAWSTDVNYTDMPEGTWKFHIAKEDSNYMCILYSEY